MNFIQRVAVNICLMVMVFGVSTLFADFSKLIHSRGIITNEGIECLTFRGKNGILYSIVGELEGYKAGDLVEIVAKPAEVSFCMQGQTLEVLGIAKIAYDQEWFIVLEGKINSGGLDYGKCILLETDDGKRYGLVTNGRLIKLLNGHYTVIATPLRTKDMPCGDDVDIAVDLFHITE